jgi:hypothetical protein
MLYSEMSITVPSRTPAPVHREFLYISASRQGAGLRVPKIFIQKDINTSQTKQASTTRIANCTTISAGTQH